MLGSNVIYNDPMKVAYISPYEGESDYVEQELPDVSFTFIDGPLKEENLAQLAHTELLSVFVDSKVDKEAIDAMSNLKHIATRSTGYDHIDVAYASEKGITVSSVPRYGSRTVAEYTFALILALSRKAYAAYDRLRREGTTDVKDFEGFDLDGKTIGVIGTGAIGKNVIKIARGFNMNVIAFDMFPDEQFATDNQVKYVTLEEILGSADIITIHVPLREETKHLIGEEELAKCKPSTYLINTARGEIVDTKALVQALGEKRIAGAGLDVLEGERYIMDEQLLLTDDVHDINQFKTLVADHSLIDMDNAIVTPHIAFNSKEAKREITDTTIGNIRGFISGEPENLVKNE